VQPSHALIVTRAGTCRQTSLGRTEAGLAGGAMRPTHLRLLCPAVSIKLQELRGRDATDAPTPVPGRFDQNTGAPFTRPNSIERETVPYV
jgi:hypothetical protein